MGTQNGRKRLWIIGGCPEVMQGLRINGILDREHWFSMRLSRGARTGNPLLRRLRCWLLWLPAHQGSVQLLERKRLAQVVIHPRYQTLLTVPLHSVCREGNDGHMRLHRLCFAGADG